MVTAPCIRLKDDEFAVFPRLRGCWGGFLAPKHELAMFRAKLLRNYEVTTTARNVRLYPWPTELPANRCWKRRDVTSLVGSNHRIGRV